MPTRMLEELEARIVDLWGRRHGLAKGEWDEFAKLVFAYLGAKNFSHYATLQRCYPFEDYESLKRQLVEDFFTDKIFLPAIAEGFQSSVLVSARALINPNYKNYLIDRIRRCKPGSDQPDDLLDPPEEDEPCMSKLEECKELVEAHGDIQKAATGFLEGEERCGWILLFLGCHQCADSEDRPALQWLAKKHSITSYARRAKELGITRPHGGYTREAPWSATMLGKWLMGVGIDVDHITEPNKSRTHRGDQQISEALKILCCEALKRVSADNCC